jgi:hypothetical protein
MTDSNPEIEEFKTVDDLANQQNFIDCYQIQVDDNNNCTPVHLGKYPDVPLPVNKVIKYKEYLLHIVTYVLTKEEIDNNIYKIVGVNVFKKNTKNSICSLDLSMNPVDNMFELVFSDHIKNKFSVIEKIEKFPGKDNVLEYIITKTFEEPIISILLK